MNSTDEIFLEVEKGILVKVKQALENGIELEKLKKDARNLLHCAVESGQEPMVEFLLDNDFDIDEVTSDIDGYSPLHLACRKGNVSMVTLLLSKGADKNLKDKYQATPLHKACRGHFIPVVQILLENGADVEIGDNNRWTALHRSCATGRLELVQLLVAQGASLESVDINGATALHIASDSGKKDVVSFLIQKGGNVCSQDNSLLTPLAKAARKGWEEVAGILLSSDENCSNLLDTSGRSVLHIAAEEEQVNMIKFLLKTTTIDLEITDSKGFTVLDTAIKRGNLEIVKELITKGANFNKQGDICPVFLCCRDTGLDVLNSKLVQILEFLIKQGADITTPNKGSLMPIHYACQNGNLAMVQCLVRVGKVDVTIPALGKLPVDYALPFKVDIANFLNNPSLHKPILSEQGEKDTKQKREGLTSSSSSRACTVS